MNVRVSSVLKLAPARPQMRFLLSIAFGGLLALLSITGLIALSVISELQTRNERIRSEYVRRATILEQLRSDIYLSGTYVRDFLLETNSQKAEGYRQDFSLTRTRIEHAISEYGAIRQPDEAAAFESLARETNLYFSALGPALAWNAEERRKHGRSFMYNEVLLRRMTMIDLANKVGEVNQRQLEAGNRQVRALFLQFRRELIALLIFTISIGVVLALLTVRRMLQLEKQARWRYSEAVQARSEAQELSAKLVDAQEDERRRVARELHDEIGQSLSALLVGIGNLAQLIPAESDAGAQNQIRIIRGLAEQSVAAVRNMSLLLRPSMLDDLGLIPALQWQAREVSRATGMRVSIAAEEITDQLPDEYKTSIYRIVQEALHNCQRHSEAQRVRIQLQQTKDTLLLSIQDDGRGFRPQDRGLGLLGMEERVHRLRGRFHITSEEGKGTLLTIELPAPQTDSVAAAG